jgi:hypothetical protein
MPQFRDNFHSEEAQEIMGRAPSWVVRWGITVIFVILALIVLGCYIIKYPQTVTAPISITTVNAPSDLTARYDGLLDSVCVGNGRDMLVVQTKEILIILRFVEQFAAIDAAIVDVVKLSVIQLFIVRWISYSFR